MRSLKTRAMVKASGSDGSYFSVSIAFTVWRETPRRSAPGKIYRSRGEGEPPDLGELP